ncbi:MAG: hypothetical protein ACHQF2_07525, partial [Flavobacteriales bacterium]
FIPTTVVAPPDTSICSPGNMVNFNASGALYYNWGPGKLNGNNYYVDSSQTFIVTGMNYYFCTATDSFSVNVMPGPLVQLPNDTVVCKNSNLFIPGVGPSNLLWSTGATSSSITLFVNQNYTVMLTGTDSAGCVNVIQ